MYLHHSSNNLTTNNIDENIKDEIYDISDGHGPYKDKSEINNKVFYNCSGTIPKNELSQRSLNFWTHEESYQNYNEEEKLSPLDIFKLNKLGTYKLPSNNYSFNPDQIYASSAVKRQFIEDEPLLTEPSTKRLKLKQSTENEKTHISSPGFAGKIITAPNTTYCKILERPIIKRELRIKLCRCNTRNGTYEEQACDTSNLASTENITNISRNYEEELLPPDIFKFTKSDESDLSSISSTVKNKLIKDEPLSIESSSKRSNINQRIDREKNISFTKKIIAIPNLENTGQTVQNSPDNGITMGKPIIKKKELRIKLYRCDVGQSIYAEQTCNESSLTSTEQTTSASTSKNYEEKLPTSGVLTLNKFDKVNIPSSIDGFDPTSNTEKHTSTESKLLSISQNLKRIESKQITINENEIKKNIKLNFYRRIDSWHKKTSSKVIYRNAIKKINIDNNESFKESVLKKISKSLKKRDLLKSTFDLYKTYSNIRKYALDKISPLFDEDTVDSDIQITPGMSISDLRSSCISNNMFFKKLREYCEKIIENIRATPNDYSHLFQRNIIFNQSDPSSSTNTRIRFSLKRDEIIPKLEKLIIDTVSDLPNSIIYEIERLDQNNIVSALFSDVHGVLISKSSIKSLNLLFNSNKHKFVNAIFDDNLNLFHDLLDKIRYLVRKSCVFHEGVFLPNEPTAEELSNYLLSDMCGLSPKINKVLNKNTSKHKEPIDDIRLNDNCKKSVATNTASKKELQTSELDLTIEIGNTSSNSKDIGNKKSVTENVDQSEYSTMTKEIKLKKYHRTNLISTKITPNIYEYAIKKVVVDNNFQFKNSVLEELGTYITSEGFTKSSLDLSVTYSNVRKYVLEKVRPYVSDNVINADILITPGMSLSDIKNSSISNNVFFEKLHKKCEKIVKDIHLIPESNFLSIIQNYIYFNSINRIRIDYKKNKLCSEAKSLITETISNLPTAIINELKKFKRSEVINSLFSNIHGVHLTKSLEKDIRLFFSYNKLRNNNIVNLNFLNNLLTKLLSIVIKSPVLHEEKIFFLGESTAKSLSKYLLSDMYEIPLKLHKKILLQKNIKDKILDSNYKKNVAINISDSIKLPLLEKSILMPRQKYQWSNDRISSLNIYKLALSMIDIDRGNFENYVINKVKKKHLSNKCLRNKGKINIDLSTTYDNVKNYILEMFQPFLKGIEGEIKEKIKPFHGMTIDELRRTYTSNKKFFSRLRGFCTKLISRIKNCRDTTLIDLIQCRIHLETKTLQIEMRKKRRIEFHDCIANMLISNISNASILIIDAIKLIPQYKIVEEYFSNFCDMYLDNESLLKVKSIFDCLQEKIINDRLLRELADKISLDIIDKSGKRNRIPKIINSHIVCGKLSTYGYIRRLLKEEFPTLKDKLSDPIMIINKNKIEIADQKIRDHIFDRIRSSLIEESIKSYNKLCVKKYKLYKSKMETKK
ncbi:MULTISPECIES: hypothetical protein [Candidatus Ichthyocystis]|uniref:Uncharacterized protein n=1 Tax=Candidatus Ichthyocystis hellenicum TaxID=1561003 RepID=A0A0S4M4Y4_9BURK|nr:MULTISPECIES: hypothetical protein [Ichthyocystis]CUT18272.1 hypothetical protein Ark11_1474 [Candidatus Ichthyocystis hellenicum]